MYNNKRKAFYVRKDNKNDGWLNIVHIILEYERNIVVFFFVSRFRPVERRCTGVRLTQHLTVNATRCGFDFHSGKCNM